VTLLPIRPLWVLIEMTLARMGDKSYELLIKLIGTVHLTKQTKD